MGKVINGVNGPVSGKVGNVVFCKWKGIDYIRSLPRINRSRKPTAGQAKQRSKFRFMQDVLSSIVPLVRMGFMNHSPNRTGHNVAMSYNIKNAVTEDDAGYRIIPEKFMMSGGILAPPRETSVTLEENDQVLFRWAYRGKSENEHGLDRALLLITDFDRMLNFHTSGNFRESGEDRLYLPNAKFKRGDIFHTYLAFFATDGSNHSSDSVYIGTIEIK
ncbi:hypothetical protein H8S90_07735 [Olivibacter sp. SDN3]|uniref:DUF6266 family protein n=1 Tax=Olivibacter sp. SDN3 TaxID=2764720 RepID=UPI001650E89F|nr:DUF6266 family protein [Olivibacter sp. SDN3]QNL51454.1 hypothetical protein H8S90_07735 [Olivibacter sp. SDN3]